MEGTPLLDVMRGLILEPEAQAEFAADPSGYMQRFGYEDVPEDDMMEAVGLVADTLPPDVAHAVTTAAAAPSEGDDFGDGSVGILGRISTAEVTESVVPDMDDVPPEDAPLAEEHDATAFGDVTRDFDDDSVDDRQDDGDTGDTGAADDPADDLDDVDDRPADDRPADADGEHGGDLSFGDSSFDEDPSAFDHAPGSPDDAGGFGEGSQAEAFAAEGYEPAEPLDAPAEESFDGGLDEFATAMEDASAYAEDHPIDDGLDHLDGGDMGGHIDEDLDMGGTTDDSSFDDDVGSF